jgi:hypothetical protein
VYGAAVLLGDAEWLEVICGEEARGQKSAGDLLSGEDEVVG